MLEPNFEKADGLGISNKKKADENCRKIKGTQIKVFFNRIH